MKPDSIEPEAASQTGAHPSREPEKTARARAAALAGIAPPSAGEVSQRGWAEFNRELDARGNRQPSPASAHKTTLHSKILIP